MTDALPTSPSKSSASKALRNSFRRVAVVLALFTLICSINLLRKSVLLLQGTSNDDFRDGRTGAGRADEARMTAATLEHMVLGQFYADSVHQGKPPAHNTTNNVAVAATIIAAEISRPLNASITLPLTKPATKGGDVNRRNTSVITTTDLGPLLDQTVRMLLPLDQAEAYIEKYPGSDVKLFIYDDLPTQFTWQYSADCMNKQSDNGCDWGETFCGVQRYGGFNYGKRRFNRNGDLVLSKLFDEYRGPSRTYNASEATLFIVPFPSQAHLHCQGSRRQAYYDQIEKDLIPRLTYLTPETKHKHMFLSSSVATSSNKFIRSFPLVVSIGHIPYECRQVRKRNCGEIVMPYVNMNRDYQPNLVRSTNFKPLRERTYALVAKLNSKISGNGSVRKQLIDSATKHEQEKGALLAGKQMIVGELGANRRMGNEVEILEAYRDSIFCPCLRGDEPPQKRFFDAILSGCLPVVLEYESAEKGYVSWFAGKAAAVHNVYPFAKGTFHGLDEMGIDYSEFVVTVNGTCGARCIIPHLEALLVNDMERLEAMHYKMKHFASLFSFGMAENAFVTVDAMLAILQEARHFVAMWNVKKRA